MERFRLTRRIAILGIAVNVVLLVLKLAAGIFSRSQAMIADGFNSAGDVFASVMTFTGSKIASKPEDQRHPYGHGKAEYIFSMIISFSLLLVAYKVFRSSLDSILHRDTIVFSWWLISIAVITIAVKLSLFLYTRRAGKNEENLLILANSEDHRNDVFVTSSTLIGIITSTLGVNWIDGAVGIGISLWIAFTGLKIFKSSYSVLIDTSIDNELKKNIIEAVESIAGVDHIDNVTAKPTGFKFMVVLKVSVPSQLTVAESHSIAAKIRERVRQFKQVHDAVVHINPV